MRGTASIKVKKPVEEVWKFISDLENGSQWLDGVSTIEPTSEGENAVGATFKTVYRFDGKSHETSYLLMAFEPPHRISYRVLGGPHPAFNRLELKSAGDSTEVKHMMEMDMDRRNLGAVTLGLGPLVRLSIMFKLRKDLKKLKVRLEAS
ncbi:MAG: hypothetical protein BZY75_04605 [SAR202 cluster bacterium Io17-Chloro-G7]|nr:MAG: hypothetical protein BZY75_04605 [SAR202 cluster bacterium Io17-Chloro-G7]